MASASQAVSREGGGCPSREPMPAPLGASPDSTRVRCCRVAVSGPQLVMVGSCNALETLGIPQSRLGLDPLTAS
jgi:hypothetical protein